MSCSSYQKY